MTPLVGLSLERFAYRPLRNAPRLAPLITALGASFVLQQLVAVFYTRGASGLPRPVPGHLVPASRGQHPASGCSWSRSPCSSWSRWPPSSARPGGQGHAGHVRGPGHGPADGHQRRRIIALTFIIGSALAGIGGVLAGMYLGQVNFFMGFIAGLKAFTAAVLGGIGNIAGAVLGAFLLGILETFGAAYLGGRVAGRVRLRRAHPGAGVPADRAAGRAGGGLMAAPTAVPPRRRRAGPRPGPAAARVRLPWSRPRPAGWWASSAPTCTGPSAGAGRGACRSPGGWPTTASAGSGPGRCCSPWPAWSTGRWCCATGRATRSRARPWLGSASAWPSSRSSGSLTPGCSSTSPVGRLGPGPWVTMAGGVLVWLSARGLLGGRPAPSAAEPWARRSMLVDVGRGAGGRSWSPSACSCIGIEIDDAGRVPRLLHRRSPPWRPSPVDARRVQGPVRAVRAATRASRSPAWRCCCCCSRSPRRATPSGSR